MKLHGNLDLQGNELRRAVLPTEVNFPTDGKAGQFCFRNKAVYMCVEVVAGIQAWVPLTSSIDTYIHDQTVPALEWTINHNLDSSTVLCQVFVGGKMVIPDEVDCTTKDVVNVRFSSNQIGRAVLMLGQPFGAARPPIGYQVAFENTAEVTVNHGLGFNPMIQVVGPEGYEIQPLSVSHTDLNTTVVTFASATSGTIRCV